MGCLATPSRDLPLAALGLALGAVDVGRAPFARSALRRRTRLVLLGVFGVFRSPAINVYSRDVMRLVSFYEDLAFGETFQTPKEGTPAHVELIPRWIHDRDRRRRCRERRNSGNLAWRHRIGSSPPARGSGTPH
jgi:hypothetical protein